jgi:hypothetical protein
MQTIIHQKRKKQLTKRRKVIVFKTKIKVQLALEFNCENLSEENENRNNRKKNFKKKKIFQIIVSNDRRNIETISIRKRRE